MSDSPRQPTVAIAGGGMAGLTAAYNLAKRGYKVTLYEATDCPGGALSATPGPRDVFTEMPVNFECSPHMFGEWYNNFFALMNEIGVSKSSFEYCSTIGFLRRGQPLQYTWLKNNGSIYDGLQNLFSGVDTPSNLFLYWYAIIDILTQDFSDFSDDTISLNGFVMSRPYTPEKVALFLQQAMVNIWAIDSYLTSIYAFQTSAKYQAKSPTPTAWITTQSNSYDLIVAPLAQKLNDLGVSIKLNTLVSGVTVEGDPAKVMSITVQTEREVSEVPVDNLILAVPRFALGPLVTKSGPHKTIRTADRDLTSRWVDAVPGEESLIKTNINLAVQMRTHTIAEQIPELASANSVQGVPLAMLYVPFTKALPDIPLGYVGLTGSAGSLTFIDVPYLAGKLGAAMVLAIGISKFSSIPAAVADEGIGDIKTMRDPDTTEIVVEVLEEFMKFVSFDRADIIWSKVVLKTNTNHRLYLNTVGNRLTAPNINDDRVANLFFAVETKENPVQIATVEGAVIGGLQAAQALWARNPSSANNRNNPIVPIMPKAYTQAELWAMKIALTPWAVAAKFWSDAEAAYPATSSRGQSGPDSNGRSMVRQPNFYGAANALAQSAIELMTAPFWFGANAISLLRDGMMRSSSPSSRRATFRRGEARRRL